VRQHLAGHRHRRRAAADRADGNRGRSASRLDELYDVDHDDHDLLVVQRRFLLVGRGSFRERLLGHVGLVRHGVERRRDGLEWNQRFRLERRLGSDRRWRISKRRDDALERQLGLRLDQRRRRPPVAVSTAAAGY
jgi:hypothetical protein